MAEDAKSMRDKKILDLLEQGQEDVISHGIQLWEKARRGEGGGKRKEGGGGNFS